VTVFSYRLPEARYADEPSQLRFHRELLDRLARLPGVAATGASWLRPSSDNEATVIYHDGSTTEPQATWPNAPINIVDAGYFRTLGMTLLEGRLFEDTDTPGSPRVLLVNQTFARALAPGGPVLGRRLLMGVTSDAAPDGTLWEIVGIVGDTRSRGLDRPAPPRMYLPIAQVPLDLETVLIRSALPPAALEGPIREQLAAVDPLVAANRIQDLDEMTRDLLADRRQTLALLGIFALLALFLGAVGIYGLLAYAVAQRGRELAIRMALGARGGQILSLVFGQGARLVGLGLALGIAAYLAAGRVLAHLVVDLSAFDAATLVVVPCLLAVVGCLACLVPALRASRVDPAVALRAE
jgi:predicted permease